MTEIFFLNLEIFWVFFKISLISLGGVFGVLPELERMVVQEHHWISHDQFIQSYVMSQFVPGPNMAMCPMVGYWVAGIPGWISGFIGIYLGPILTMSLAFFIYNKYRELTAVRRAEAALRPLVIGLLTSSMIHFWISQSQDQYLLAAILSSVGIFFYKVKKVDPLKIIISFGVLWALFFQIPQAKAAETPSKTSSETASQTQSLAYKITTEDILKRIKEQNKKDQVPDIPELVSLSESEYKIIQEATQSIPDSISAKIKKYLSGIYVVKNLGSSGLTLEDDTQKNPYPKSFVVLDIKTLQQTGNEWLTYKEKLPFDFTNSKAQLQAELLDPKQDHIGAGFQFILLHELGHVLLNSHTFNIFSAQDSFSSPKGFAAVSWKKTKGHFKPKIENEEIFSKIHFYLGNAKATSANEIFKIYSSLKNSSFSTLYSTLDPEEDFADSFATYTYTILMKRPYRLHLSLREQNLTYESCFTQPRCNTKRLKLEKILALTKSK